VPPAQSILVLIFEFFEGNSWQAELLCSKGRQDQLSSLDFDLEEILFVGLVVETEYLSVLVVALFRQRFEPEFNRNLGRPVVERQGFE